MKSLQVHTHNFMTYQSDQFTIQIQRDTEFNQLGRMIGNLRIGYQDYLPLRQTLDLYNEKETEGLIRNICTKWELKISEVEMAIHSMISTLDKQQLEELKAVNKLPEPVIPMSQEDEKNALKTLKSNALLPTITQLLNTVGIIGEDRNSTILFLALASHKYRNPFSVICRAKSGIGKSYMLQKLSECLPLGSVSYHTQISDNALYYMKNYEINHKALLIEELEWSNEMLAPLAKLQSRKKLVKTRPTKNKEGMYNSTTFEVIANLCLVAFTQSDKNDKELNLPFLCLDLGNNSVQDELIMNYQKKLKAGLIPPNQIAAAQTHLKHIITALKDVSIINPYATLIELPKEITHQRKTLSLLLNYIETITYFFQYQREEITDQTTGEIYINTHPDDIELAFTHLKDNLFKKADELSINTRKFYDYLMDFLNQNETNQFTAFDIRKEQSINPRTLSRYLQELKLYNYVQVIGGNKHRGGYKYQITTLGNQAATKQNIEKKIENILKKIKKEHQKNH